MIHIRYSYIKYIIWIFYGIYRYIWLEKMRERWANSKTNESVHQAIRHVQPRFGTDDCAAGSGSFLSLVSGFLRTKQTEPGPPGRLTVAAGRFLTAVVSFLSLGYTWQGRNHIRGHWQNLEPLPIKCHPKDFTPAALLARSSTSDFPMAQGWQQLFSHQQLTAQIFGRENLIQW